MSVQDAYLQMLNEAKKKEEKMDPVGQADADIDNDGDVDDSDEYLHKKRKAIKKAVKDDEKEVDEAIEIDDEDGEVSKHSDDKKKKKKPEDNEAEGEVNELDQSTVVNYRKKAVAQGRTAGAAQAKRMYGRGGAQRNTRREATETDLFKALVERAKCKSKVNEVEEPRAKGEKDFKATHVDNAQTHDYPGKDKQTGDEKVKQAEKPKAKKLKELRK